MDLLINKKVKTPNANELQLSTVIIEKFIVQTKFITKPMQSKTTSNFVRFKQTKGNLKTYMKQVDNLNTQILTGSNGFNSSWNNANTGITNSRSTEFTLLLNGDLLH